MSGVNLNDYRNDAGEWLVGPEQIRADMNYQPEPYDDFWYDNGYDDDYYDDDLCYGCNTEFDDYASCECDEEGGGLEPPIREDFGWFGEMGLRD